jgi:hypothetical protein
MQAVAKRLESRKSVSTRVDLCSLDMRQRIQECLTENVSMHGARVVSSKPWKRNERLNVYAVPGDFRARARVVYCEPLGMNSFAIGLKLLAATGKWN